MSTFVIFKTICEVLDACFLVRIQLKQSMAPRPLIINHLIINDLSLDVNSSGSDERRMAVEYFMRVGYGMHRYDFEDVEHMFDGLNWLRYQQYEKRGKAYTALQSSFLKEWFAEWKTKMKTG